jgi:MATE family multidrug resistance protein
VWAIGLPIAITLGLEVTVFNAAVFLMGLLGRAQLAAHSIAIQIAALCFMVPMGIGQAATVRVGFAIGQKDYAACGRAGWLALMLGTAFAICSGSLLIGAPRWLVGGFIDLANPANAEVIRFRHILPRHRGAVPARRLRAGDRRGRAARVAGYAGADDLRRDRLLGDRNRRRCADGLPVSKLGGIGIWWGLATGLGVVAVMMVLRWTWRERLGLLPA